MKFPGKDKWQAEQQLQGELASKDPHFLRAAAGIDLDHIKDTGRREEAFEDLAVAAERYCLDPQTVREILRKLYPGLKDIAPPPHDEKLLVG